MKPHRCLSFVAWFMTFYFCAPTTIVALLATDALAQTPSPAPAPALPVLTVSTIVALVLPAVIAVLAETAKSGTLFGRIPLAAAVLPWLVTVGAFLFGAEEYLRSVSFAVTTATVVYAVVQGLLALVSGSAPALVVHHVTTMKTAKAAAQVRLAAMKTTTNAV